MIIQLHTKPLPLETGPQPKADLKAAQQAAVPHPSSTGLQNAPALLEEWVGREDLLAQLAQDWDDPCCRVVGLVGFAGEGKTSIARKWLDYLSSDTSQIQPAAVFWWGFYEQSSVDEFLEAALTFLSNGRINLKTLPTPQAKANFLAGMIQAAPYIFVLDGIETLQYQEGDEYGLLISNELLEFLSYFASTSNQSFCLLTSRAPLYDLIDYVTYKQRDVNRLSDTDGRNLLRKLGVKGTDKQVDQIVSQWEGHALTLNLLGIYLDKQHGGFLEQLPVSLSPIAGEPKYTRVSRLLRRYDDSLTKTEKDFLILFSAFRKPTSSNILNTVIQIINRTTDNPGFSLGKTEQTDLSSSLNRLVEYRILRHNKLTDEYTSHPLIRTHYSEQLEENTEKAKHYYQAIAACYYTTGTEPEDASNVSELALYLEAIYYACHARNYDTGFAYWLRIREPDVGVSFLSHRLGAFETELAVLKNFFPNEDITLEPQVSDINSKRLILGTVGFCLMAMGRLRDAVNLFERSNKIEIEVKDWGNASITFYNLSDLYGHLGELNASEEAANHALAAAVYNQRLDAEIFARARLGWIAHLRGQLKRATEFFKQAEKLQIAQDGFFLYGQRGIKYADHLRKTGSTKLAIKLLEFNIEFLRSYSSPTDLSCCYRVLADIEAKANKNYKARKHYDEAIRIARSTSNKAVLIEALGARGKWAASREKLGIAEVDLHEALEYALFSGYRLYEADIRIGLSTLYLVLKSVVSAKKEAERAKQMSVEMGYFWGKKNAIEILNTLEKTT